jgi:hypothetical protein
MHSKLFVGGVTAAVAVLLATNPVVVDAAGQISGSQIKNNSVASKDVKNNSLKGGDVKDNSLGGADVDESTLGTVPSATNASTLGGQAADRYLARVAQTSNPANQVLTANVPTRVLGPLSLTVPAAIGFAEVNVTAGFTGGNTPVTAWFQVDNATCAFVTSPGFDNRAFSDTTPSQTTVNYTLVVPVTAGAHTFVLCVGASAAVTSRFNTLSVQTIPVGATGGATLRMGPPAPDTDLDPVTAE